MGALTEEMEREEPCVNLVIGKHAENGEPERAATHPVASEIAYRELDGAPQVNGTPVASRILIFADERHIK